MKRLTSFFIFVFLIVLHFFAFGQAPDTSLARIYIDSVKVLRNNNDFDQALKLNKKAIEIYENLLGTESLLTANSYRNLAVTYDMSGESLKALNYFKKDLNMKISILGENHLEVAKSYNNLSMAYQSQGKYKVAVEKARKSLKIKLSLLEDKNDVSLAKSYHNIGIIYQNMDDLNACEENWEKALYIRINAFGNRHVEVADSYHTLGSLNQSKGDYLKAIEYGKKALEIRLDSLGETNLKVANSYNNISLAYRKLGNYIQGLDYAEKALKIRIAILGSNENQIADSYNNIALMHHDLGDYAKALNFFNKALAIKLRKKGERHHEVATFYENMGSTHRAFGNTAKAIENHNRALDIRIESLGKTHTRTAISYNNLGNAYLADENYETAIKHFKRSLELIQLNLPKDHPYISIIKSNVGLAYYESENYVQATIILKECLYDLKKILGEKHPEVVYVNRLLGDVFLNTNDTTAALHYYSESANAANLDLKNPDVQNVQFNIDLIKSLEKIAICSINNGKKQQSVLRSCHRLIDHFNQMINESSSQIQFKDNIISTYETSISLSQNWMPRNMNQEFEFAEKGKATVLLSNVRSSSSGAYFNLPDSIRNRDSELKFEINQWEKLVFNEEKKDKLKNDSIIMECNSKIFDAKQRQEKLLTIFKNNYPEYYRLKYNAEVVTIKEVQNLLREDQTIVEYFVGNENIFIFTITPTEFEISRVKKDFPLERWAENLRNSIYLPVSKRSLSKIQKDSLNKEYVKYATQLYEKLISPIPIKLSKNLIIIPDAALSYLPFDALLFTKPKKSTPNKDYPYMIKNHAISYNYSATLFNETCKKESIKKPKRLLAIAPNFESKDQENLLAINELRNSLTPLIWSYKEVSEICNLTNGEPLLNEEATLDNFLEIADDYQILHLSTHGKANDQVGNYSFIAFSEVKDTIDNERLYVKDLYGIQLNSDMVVLSACETGLGKLERGEGVIGMTRGFLYAGAKSIVTSLWSINDKSSQEIMSSFYEHLQSGKTKDEALRDAKLSYIHDNSVNSSPFYWAAFVPIGDMESIDLTDNDVIWWVGGLMLLALVCFFIFKKIR